MAKSKRPPPIDVIPAATLLTAYSRGIFPMAEERDDEDVFWVDPDHRGILPLDSFRVSHRLARTIRSTRLRLTVDTAFADVMAACAEPAPQRPKTWINPLIERSYCDLHSKGHAHSVEVWDGVDLVGGLYGVSIGAAFFGESMFSRQRDTSKVALVHLVARLKAGGYVLLDTQFVTEHLTQFGAIEIGRELYRNLLRDAVGRSADFYVLGGAGAAVCAGTVLQLTTQTS
jgi:leucyl/phenylalanyl-tRNA---protein transferase